MKDCALKWSVRNGHANVVKLLLDSGADHLSINKFLINEYPEVIDILQQHMIDKYEKEKEEREYLREQAINEGILSCQRKKYG